MNFYKFRRFFLTYFKFIFIDFYKSQQEIICLLMDKNNICKSIIDFSFVSKVRDFYELIIQNLALDNLAYLDLFVCFIITGVYSNFFKYFT